jgi:extracellular elastinolytic metalloproteinase
MSRSVKVFVIATVALSLATVAGAQNRGGFEPPAARVSQPRPGGTLTPPSTASARATLVQFLRAQGRDDATAQSPIEGSRANGRDGLTHVQFEQRAGALPVYGTYAKATFNGRGELVHLIENLAVVPAGIGRARVSAQQAIDAAVANLYPAMRTVPAGFFRRAPAATRVAVPHPDGTMTAGFVVETWTEQRNELNETLVDGNGTVLSVESRTNNDTYNVFRKNPVSTPQAIVSGPGSGNASSPSGWLFAGAQGSTNIAGNNANAYLDAISDNRSDGNGSTVTGGNFTTAANLAASPSTSGNRAVAIQNLFYLNNLIHDELYRQGFDETSGNFQENNFGKGGRGSDSVNAEAQDGGGTDNANFATPRDGSNPRMQMYLWNGRGTHQVVVGSTTSPAGGAEFGPKLTTTGVTAVIALVSDSGGVSTTDACEALPASSMGGKIALIDRGTCDFTVKVKNAQNAGATAAIVANNRDGDSIQTMGGTDSTITIPAVFISQNDGTLLKAKVPVSGTVRLTSPAPLSRDGDLDSDIVFHEYCHGLTWRMIGRMDGPLAGAIGEGMSDVCALLLNGDDRIGEYSASDARGIRRFPYANYPNTYSDVTGAEVHDDGEIYGAIGWKLIELFGTRTDALFGYIVDGMHYTPAAPTYEAMRDGILQSIAGDLSAPAGDDCLVWRAFAQYGVGVGAKGTAKGSSVKIVESFTLPAACTP